MLLMGVLLAKSAPPIVPQPRDERHHRQVPGLQLVFCGRKFWPYDQPGQSLGFSHEPIVEGSMHSHRVNAYEAAPAAIQALRNVEAYLHQSGLDKNLIELVKMRASQINGCAYCLDMHSKDLRRLGESEQRIYLLNAWRESPLYTPKERAALAWTDALTLVSQTHAPDAVYNEVREHFDDKELVDLTTLIGMINLWNRLAISLRYEHPVDKAA
jgi:AhpD family alkylhydroperoxidase